MDILPLVPFGKYKGQPITTLMNDTKYLEWCKKQEWFQKFPIVYNICINQTLTTTDLHSKTPEHNKMQNMFLERNFNITFINYLYKLDESLILLNSIYDNEDYKIYFGDQKFNTNEYGLEKKRITPVFETIFNWDVRLSCNGDDNTISLDSKYSKDDIPILFEGADVWSNSQGRYKFPGSIANMYIEIKPLMGDDYPNVLRKMTTQQKLTRDSHRSGIYILFIDEYASQHTTKEQIIQIFKLSDIRVVFLCDLFNKLPKQIIPEKIQDIDIHSSFKYETEEENKLLREQLLHEEEHNKLLQEKLLKAKEKFKQAKAEIKHLEEENKLLQENCSRHRILKVIQAKEKINQERLRGIKSNIIDIEKYVRIKLGQQIFPTPIEKNCEGKKAKGFDDCGFCDSCEYNVWYKIVWKRSGHLRFDRDARNKEEAEHNKYIIELFDEDFMNKKIVILSWKGHIAAYVISKLDYEKYDYWGEKLDEENMRFPHEKIIDMYNKTTIKIIIKLIKFCKNIRKDNMIY